LRKLLAEAVIAMRKTRSVTTIRHAPIYGQRMIIQKVSSSPLAFSDYLMYPQEMRRFDLSGLGLLMTWQASCSWGESVRSPAFRRKRPISRNESIADASA
jgi:hypothetical protein